MTFKRFSIAFAVCTIFTYSCGVDIENAKNLSAPQWVIKSMPEEWPERGIDAHESGGIYLEWEPNSGEKIQAYSIYRSWSTTGDSMNEYRLLSRLETDVTPECQYIDDEVEVRTLYCYKIISEDDVGNLSDYSDSLCYTLLPMLETSSMTPNGLTSRLGNLRKLIWSSPPSTELEDYCVTVLTSDNILVLREVFTPSTYIPGSIEYFQIPSAIDLDSGQVYKWRYEIGANYVDSRESAGAESPWATFLYSIN